MKTYDILYRETSDGRTRFSATPDAVGWYEEEDLYLENRRTAVQRERPVRGENLRGIALSGGGIRSATFSLGVLQALAKTDRLKEYDYLSGTSGGAYITAWLMAHYTTDPQWLMGAGKTVPPGEGLIGRDGWEALSPSLESLLLGQDSCGIQDCDDQLLVLQSHSQFLNQGRMVESAYWLGEYVWRLPFSLVFDVALHTKSNWNWYHLISEYSDRIGETYLAGVKDVPLRAINRRGNDAPYAIINANLINDSWANAVSGERSSSNPFEFTADVSGADAIGYIDSEALDAKPTGNVTESLVGEDGRRTRRVELRDSCSGDRAGHPDGGSGRTDRLFCDPSLRLRDAVAASGAAFDPDGVLTRIDNYGVRQAASFIAAPLNFNLGLETWNYSSDRFGWKSPVGYLQMQTAERIANPSPDSRWIKITDGGHFENTSVFSLLRRGVGDILAVDAGADPETKNGDRRTLARVVRDRLHLVPAQPGDWYAARTVLYEADRAHDPAAAPVATITWIKPSRCFCETAQPELRQLAVKACARAKAEKAFPHTSTVQQWYTIEQFEAYRTLGYAQTLQALDGEPREACPSRGGA